MSMFDLMYNQYAPNHCEVPGWAKAERYEYCESYARAHKPSRKHAALVQLVLSVLPGIH